MCICMKWAETTELYNKKNIKWAKNQIQTPIYET